MGLNRTSVGLKPRVVVAGFADRWVPQSNQRGIETGARSHANDGFVLGLNRTSVGLKLFRYTLILTAPESPQSNQRGIETGVRRVGLQPHRRPQSNQRGIETKILSTINLRNLAASIEPAWD